MESTAQVAEQNRVVIVAVLLTGSFIAILNQTSMVTALPPIMKDLNIDAAKAQWLTTVFMLMNGIMIPITAFLIERYTTRRLFITAMSLFTAGSIIAAVSPNFLILLLGRIVQASAAGILMPLMQTVLFLIFPIEKRGTAMGMAGLVIAFAPALGPTLSGWITDHYTWRYIFYLILPIAVLDILLAVIKLKNVSDLMKPRIDILSIILSSVGFGGLLYGFSSAGSRGWGNNDVIITLIIGLISLIFFIRRQLKLEKPILELRVFKNSIFTLTTIITMIVFTTMIAAETIIPMYIQNVRGLSALQSGLILFPGAILMGIMSPINGRIYDKFGARGLVLTGLTLLTAATIPFTSLDNSVSLTFLTLMYAVRMFGVSMIMMPLTAAALNQLHDHLIPHGNAVTNTMRQVAGSIGTAMLITIMSVTAAHADTNQPAQAMLQGINTAFIAATILSFTGLTLSFFICKE
ncbi:MAG: DHA2 family efflux MFS transporter permease subunit [Clostridiales bacterium]|nr:DHA2 family efflux MFS transporter permease subunit [Clostridiales bacterium]MCF8022818.1 DHA2 family efflux MFS transporter permease subunit [Clostridiales bacterium]